MVQVIESPIKIIKKCPTLLGSPTVIAVYKHIAFAKVESCCQKANSYFISGDQSIAIPPGDETHDVSGR